MKAGKAIVIMGAIGGIVLMGCKEEVSGTPDPPKTPPKVEQPPKPNLPGGSAEKPRPPKDMNKPPSDPKDKDFVGMGEEAAGKLAEKRGLKHRVVERDGQMLPATRDYRPDRVNFTVAKGQVTKVSRG